MTYKERKAKRTDLFSLKAYLYKKAQLRALKLRYREARRAAKKDGNSLDFADFLASLQQAAPVEAHAHEHGADCDHGELEVIDEQS